MLRRRGSPEAEKIVVLYQGSPVAELWQAGGKFAFRYLPAFGEQRLPPLPGFKQIDAEHTYKADELFRYFRERIPDPSRPEIAEELRKRGLDTSDFLRVLATLGAHVVTDSFELKLSPAR